MHETNPNLSYARAANKHVWGKGPSWEAEWMGQPRSSGKGGGTHALSQDHMTTSFMSDSGDRKVQKKHPQQCFNGLARASGAR